jgi:hypothetical protein
MSVLKKYSSKFIENLQYINRRYIYIRNILEKKVKTMDDSVIQFYRQLLLRDILRRDLEYCLLCNKFPGDVSELILRHISTIEPESGMIYLGRPPHYDCVNYKSPPHIQMRYNVPQYLAKYERL